MQAIVHLDESDGVDSPDLGGECLSLMRENAFLLLIHSSL